MAVRAQKQSLVKVLVVKDSFGRFGRLQRGMEIFISRHDADALKKVGVVRAIGTTKMIRPDESKALSGAADSKASESAPREAPKKLSRKEKKRARKK